MKTIDEALAQLEKDPRTPIVVTVRGLEVEIRVVAPCDRPPPASAREAFERLGPWEGESQDEILRVLREARLAGATTGEPPRL